MSALLTTEDLSIGYKKSGKQKIIVESINLSLNKGEFVCIIGQNGSGKTTLLKTIAGVHPPTAGKVFIKGKSFADHQPASLAKMLSVVLTDRISVTNLNVYTLVSLGRYPYTNWIGRLSKEDEDKIFNALQSTHTLQFAERKLTELSDGELQKVLIAKALAQDTEVILLDEPTAHLDLPNRIEIFELLRKLARETGKAVLLSTHELDLALHSSDKIWLIQTALSSTVTNQLTNSILSGVPEDLVLSGSFEKAFENRGLVFDRFSGRFKLPFTNTKTVNLTGSEVVCYWTSVALEREGFSVDNTQFTDLKIEAIEESNEWRLQSKNMHKVVHSIEELIQAINSKAFG